MADPFASFIDPNTGQPSLVPQSQAPKGIPYFLSAGIDPATGATPEGDVFNQFRGYVGPQGGGFGSGPGSRTAFESLSGVSADKLGDTSGWTPDQWNAVTRQFGGIANRDPASIDAALASDNPFIQRTAAAYKSGRGGEGLTDAEFARFQQGGLDALNAPPAAAAPASAPPPASADAPPVDADPFGRFDTPASPRHGVITPAYEAQLRARAMPTAAIPADQPDPFAPFTPQLAAPGSVTPFSAPTSRPTFNTGVAPANTPPAVDPAPPLNDGVAAAPPGSVITESAQNMVGGVPVAQSAGFAGAPSWGGSAPFSGGGGFGGFRPVGSVGRLRGGTGAFVNKFFRPVKKDEPQTVAGAATGGAAGGGAGYGLTGMAAY